ncbi:MAG: dephospho-CoA kinase [Calditrichaeota bacterium]|nr:MAG: dephospho-CoA kinase [Calditrichota bacterium]MBL1203866.1 dephospho-CoA kinase [Calditrichota bacterium]NOG43698.1 dephospho-CoA kinase [Calditrichota bacterium]
MKYRNPLVIGVTGGMGSGQSSVCSFFEEWGAKVINADDEAKNAIKMNKVLQSDLKKAFGADIFDRKRKLNTKRLAELAFKDELQTRKLNQLVHPRMVENLIEKMEKARFSGKYPLIIIDAALIFEISIERNFDHIVVVNAPVGQRQKRVVVRDKISRKDFYDRVNKQIKLEDKVSWGDFVINNNTSLEDLKMNSQKVYNKLLDIQKAQEKPVRSKRRRNPRPAQKPS